MICYRKRKSVFSITVLIIVCIVILTKYINVNMRHKVLTKIRNFFTNTYSNDKQMNEIYKNLTTKNSLILSNILKQISTHQEALDKETISKAAEFDNRLNKGLKQMLNWTTYGIHNMKERQNAALQSLQNNIEKSMEHVRKEATNNINQNFNVLQEKFKLNYEDLSLKRTEILDELNRISRDNNNDLTKHKERIVHDMNMKLSEIDKKALHGASEINTIADADTSRFPSKRSIPDQQCIIPNLNPYHPDVMLYVKYYQRHKCQIKKTTEIIDGKLHLIAENIQNAGFYYILRVDDFNNKLSEWHPLMEPSNGTNVDVSEKLTDEFIRVDITENNITRSEYHLYVTKDNNKSEKKQTQTKKTSQDENKLNILMLMVDSLSHANAVRMLNKTYGYLRDDPETTILQGHSVVGDGTTPQLCVMFTGKQEHDLPEARRGFKDSKSIDRWPFIFNDFETSGYKTLYSEDETIYGTFQYRLYGWDKRPTTKYLRPWWIATQKMIAEASRYTHSCPHEIAFQYTKDLYATYKEEKKFSFFVFSNLAHGHPNDAQQIDDDFISLMEHFKSTGALENTVVMLFGDHGSRNDEHRATMQGKLEERLPLMAIKMPEWFSKKYPESIKNLKENSEILTSHYDIHATLKHLLTFPHLPDLSNLTYGRSLFTNIKTLNRFCKDAGIDDHWCPCLQYESIDVESKTARDVTKFAVDYINNQTNGKTEMCVPFTISQIIRIGKKHIHETVERFVSTYRDEKCDACGVKLDSNITLSFEYEVVFKVSPGDGIFEATIIYSTKTKQFEVNQSVSRLNKYANQPRCIAKEFPYLRKYCYCKG